ncbi:MAG: hypothetical protein ABTR20_13360 [Candidatus Competibacter sp.]
MQKVDIEKVKSFIDSYFQEAEKVIRFPPTPLTDWESHLWVLRRIVIELWMLPQVLGACLYSWVLKTFKNRSRGK